MESMFMKFLAFLLMVVLIVGVTPWRFDISAEASDSKKDAELYKLRIQAEIMQKIVSRVAETSNATEELRLKVMEILTAEVYSMQLEELRSFMINAKEILVELRRNIDSSKLMSEEEVVKKLNKRLVERLEKSSMGEEELNRFTERLRHAISFENLKRILEDVRSQVILANTQSIVESILNFANESAEWGDVAGLERALDSSTKVLLVLERVRDRLISINASSIAVTAIECAMEKISIMRELLASVKEKVDGLKEKRDISSYEIKELIGDEIKDRSQRIKERLMEHIEELRELREIAIEENLTAIVNELDIVLDRLEDIANTIGNNTFRFKQAIIDLTKAKGVLENAENILRKALGEKKLQLRFLEQLRKEMGNVERECEHLRSKIRELKERLPREMLSKVEELEKMFEEILSKTREADKNLSVGKDVDALKLVEEAKKLLDKMKGDIDELVSGQKGKGDLRKVPKEDRSKDGPPTKPR